MMHTSQSAVVAVTGGILASVFIAALLALLFICRSRLCFGWSSKKKEIMDTQQSNSFHVSRSDIHLISGLEMEDGEYLSSIDPEDLMIYHPDLVMVLESHRWKWVDDALGIVPLCLQLLKGCHLISERLVTTAMASTDQHKFIELAMVAKSVLPLVDNLLRSMCPPIQAREVENRSAALLKAVYRLGKLTERTCHVTWPSAILDEMNSHYQQLEAIARRSESHEENLSTGSVTIVESSMT